MNTEARVSNRFSSNHPFLSWAIWFAAAAIALVTVSPTRVTAQRVPASADALIEVTVPAVGGVVKWNDVAASVARSLTLDEDSIRQMLPHGSIDLRSDAMMLMLLGIDLAFGDTLSVDVVGQGGPQPALRVRCRREAFAGAASEPLADPVATQTRATIHTDRDWKSKIESRPLVVCIHGLKGNAETFDGLRTHLQRQGFATATIRYNDNQSIQQSAREIARLVESTLKQAGSVEPRVALVGHSMGGLVAREWVENPAIDSNRVAHLFTVATPHHGSNWASLPPMLNMVTGEDFAPEDLMSVLLHQPTSLGLRDLQPGSEQLNRMASRGRDARVAYTTIIGTGSPAKQVDVDALRDTLTQLDQDGSLLRLIRPRIRPLLENFDELVQGKGDGVVSVQNATLEGVDDVVTVDRSHGEIFQPAVDGDTQLVWQAISDRLSR